MFNKAQGLYGSFKFDCMSEKKIAEGAEMVNAEFVGILDAMIPVAVTCRNRYQRRVRKWRQSFPKKKIQVKDRNSGLMVEKEVPNIDYLESTTRKGKKVYSIDWSQYPEAEENKKQEKMYDHMVKQLNKYTGLINAFIGEEEGTSSWLTRYINACRQMRILERELRAISVLKITKGKEGDNVEVTPAAATDVVRDELGDDGPSGDNDEALPELGRFHVTHGFARLLCAARSNPSTGHRAAPRSAPATRRPAEAAPSWMAKLM